MEAKTKRVNSLGLRLHKHDCFLTPLLPMCNSFILIVSGTMNPEGVKTKKKIIYVAHTQTKQIHIVHGLAERLVVNNF